MCVLLKISGKNNRLYLEQQTALLYDLANIYVQFVKSEKRVTFSTLIRQLLTFTCGYKPQARTGPF
jgi:hypothetical protein